MREISTQQKSMGFLKGFELSQLRRILRGYPVFHVGLFDYFSSRKRLLVFLFLQLLPLLAIGLDRNEYRYLPVWVFGNNFVTYTFTYYINVILVIETIFFALSITRDEIDRETISYWINTPIYRFEIILWKYVAYVCFSCLMFFPPTIILFALQGHALAVSCSAGSTCLESVLPFLINALLIEFIAIILYGAIFFLFAIIFSRPLLPALLVAFIDVFFSNTPFAGVFGSFSPAYHLRSITYQLQLVRRGTAVVHLITGYDNPSSPFSIVYITTICLFLAIFFFRRKDLHHQV
ncbi:MAG: hypothetical protein ACFFD4_04165 [Candidatus Odinarchaeota archaeon]